MVDRAGAVRMQGHGAEHAIELMGRSGIVRQARHRGLASDAPLPWIQMFDLYDQCQLVGKAKTHAVRWVADKVSVKF